MGTQLKDIDLANLNNNQGFKIMGAQQNDRMSYSVSSAGDINNDGIDDIIIGAYLTSVYPNIKGGESYIIFGRKNGFEDIELSLLSPAQGFKILGANGDFIGFSVKKAGDVNGDNITDIIIGGTYASPLNRAEAGESYVIYGRNSTIINDINLARFNNALGFKILGANPYDYSGNSVSRAGDINNDGIDDIIIGAPAPAVRESLKGNSYIIYGKNSPTINNIDLRYLNSSQGLKILGTNLGDYSGWSVSNAGDINNDGIDDVIIGAPLASPLNRTHTGESYVIYGSKYSFNIDLATLNSTQGFKIIGANPCDESGFSVSEAGDVNGDSLADIIIGAPYASPLNRTQAGESYIIYGRNGTIINDIDLRYLNSSQGFKILGAQLNVISGFSVSSAGDINGDGLADIVIGAPYASPLNRTQAGESYIIYGRNSTIINDIDLAVLNSTQGFKIEGPKLNVASGWSVSSTGDINDDGLVDIIIGAPSIITEGIGTSYVIYGTEVPTPTPEPAPEWLPYVEIGVPVIVGAALLIGTAFSWYKYNYCHGFFNKDSEQIGLINPTTEDATVWYT